MVIGGPNFAGGARRRCWRARAPYGLNRFVRCIWYGAIKPLGSTSLYGIRRRAAGGNVFQYRLPVELSVEKQKGTKGGVSYRTVGR